jgi:nitrogen fixation NifU-like protein
MSDIDELYQELILDHARSPHQFGELSAPTHFAKGDNPICGDEVFVTLEVDNNIIQNIKFNGEGCVLSRASASMMTDVVKGKTLEEVEQIYSHFHSMLIEESQENDPSLGKLNAFSNVNQFPMRVNCVTLSWHTLRAALKHKG